MTDSASPSPAPAKAVRPWSLLGFGLFAANGSLAPTLEVALGVADLSSSLLRLFIMAALSTVVYLTAAAHVHRTQRNPWSLPLLAACCGLLMLFPILEATSFATQQVWWDGIALICFSLGNAGLFLMWSRQIAATTPRTAGITYAASLAGASLLFLAVHAGGSMVTIAAMIALPLLSGALLARRMTDPSIPANAFAANGESVEWKIPWRPLVLIVVFSCAYGTVSHFGGNTMVSNEVGRFISSVAIFIFVAAFYARLDEGSIAKTATLCLMGALLLCGIPHLGHTEGAKLLGSIGYYGFTLYVYFALSTICFRYHAQPEWLFGTAQAAFVVASAPSGLFGDWLRDQSTTAPLTAELVLAGFVLVVGALGLFLLVDTPSRSTWGIKALRRVTGDEGQREQILGNHLADRAYCCAMIAKRYGLTQREEEVLSLLAEGKSFTAIEADLYIAHGTMRVHVQHIYKKLDVHSKEEAQQFVEDWRRNAGRS
ncbi:LuxR C-terminal-related transcriptional regulator [Adlercreutzia equolifaciens]|uniref:helix-turn-helix transcriptional regulator n=1 Tax=Adlercreutzia equolifaciens TaxID=446660 RepID=UPI0023AF1B2C|nr:LuxR C-terminal-related transcriptional regulator [Adlercreutzia equolifaciens]MDE8701359.1 LuxR C-terminal-related transcriptional regulator [Adlercreutzia equolifaciens]